VRGGGVVNEVVPLLVCTNVTRSMSPTSPPSEREYGLRLRSTGALSFPPVTRVSPIMTCRNAS
jgi:hypothetical protein